MNDCKNGTAIRFVSGLAFALMICLASGCIEKIQKPDHDDTRPVAKWVVFVKNDKADQYEYTTSGQTLQLGKQYQYSVSFIVNDPDGGVMHMAWSGGGRTACPESNKADIASIAINDSYDLQPDANGKVETQALLTKAIDASCSRLGGLVPQVVTPPGGTIKLSGEGENYFGGKATSTLTIVSDP